MGFLSKLLGRPLAVKKAMEKTYIPQLMEVMDISLPQAQVTFVKLLEQARHESSDLGTSKLPEDYGHVLLSTENEDEKIRAMLASRRNEGVKDQDVLWWWNMHDLERRMMLKVDEQRRIDRYLERGLEIDGDGLKQEMEASSTFNALVRKEIKIGNL